MANDVVTLAHGAGGKMSHELMEKVGAWGTKVSYGKETVGTIRSTFIVGKDGKVEAAWRNVKVKGHVEKVLDTALSLVKSSQ